MIALDTNVLVAAHRADSPHHNVAARVLRELAEGSQPWCIPEPCISEFLSVVTHPRNFAPPSSVAQACAQLDAWLAAQGAAVISGGPQHWPTLRHLAIRGQLQGGQMHDARVAAVCLERGVTELWTADRDFARFPELRVRNPLLQVL